MMQKSLNKWVNRWAGHIHEWYKITIEHIKCKRCWYCGKTIKL
jgi:hypothetical protein